MDCDGDGLTDGQEDVNENGVVDEGERDPRVKDPAFGADSANLTNSYSPLSAAMMLKHAGTGSYAGYGRYYQVVGTEVVDSVSCLKVTIKGHGNDKDELVVSFVGYGLYTYEPKGRVWDPINTEIPEGVIRYGNGIAADYGVTYGLWSWSQGGGWKQRNTVHPGLMTAVDIDKDGAEELVAAFSGYGLYYHDETNGWQFLNAVVPVDMKAINFYP